MADVRAAQSGDFSAAATWFGGVVPGPDDVAFANGFTVTISDTHTVQAVSNASGTGITAGGTFSLLNGCNLTSTHSIAGIISVSPGCVTTPSLGVGSSASVTANVTNPSAAAITFSAGGTLNLAGNLVAGNGQPAVNVSGSGTLNFTGAVAGSPTNSFGRGMAITGIAPIVNITGSVTGGANSSPGIFSTGPGTVINVTGNVTGGTGFQGIEHAGTLTVNGICRSSATHPAIGPCTASTINRLSGPFLLGASGNINPVQAQSWRWAPTQIPTYYEVATSGGSVKRNLFTSDNIPTANYPATSAVRSGTVYGPNSENTGTLAVPSPASVALGVATDNTTGTAVLTAAAVASAVWSAITRTLTSGGGGAPTAADVATAVRTELADELGKVDALADQMPNKASVEQVASIVQGATSA